MDNIPVETLIRLLAGVYLLWWAGAAAPGMARLARRWWLRRSPFGRFALLHAVGGNASRTALLAGWIGFLTGGLGVIAWGVELPLWAVALLVAVGLALEELREPRSLAALPGVVGFLESFRAAIAQGHDRYGALAAAGEGLPPGPVSQAVEAALERQIRHRSDEDVFGGLWTASPFLQEAVLALRASGWKASEAVEASLGMIQKRAAQALDQAGAKRVFFSRAWAARVFLQALISGGLLSVLVLSMLPGVPVVDPAEARLWIGMILVGILLRFGAGQGWPRRAAMAGVLVVSMAAYVAGLPPAAPVQASVPTPTVTITATRLPPSVTPTPSPTSTITPTITDTPRPMIKRSIPLISLPDNVKPEKRSRLYPPVWMNTEAGKNP